MAISEADNSEKLEASVLALTAQLEEAKAMLKEHWNPAADGCSGLGRPSCKAAECMFGLDKDLQPKRWSCAFTDEVVPELHEGLCQLSDEAVADVADLRRQLQTSRQALERFGQHQTDPICDVLICANCGYTRRLHDATEDIDEETCIQRGLTFTPRIVCTCGLNAALSAPKEQTAEAVRFASPHQEK